MSHPLSRELKRGYERLGVRGQGLLLAVSGGADSTALLEATAELAPALGLRLEVATLDHGLRPEAAAETSAVVAQGGRLGVSTHVRRLALAAGPGVEERARTAREAALLELCEARGLDGIVTAHTASDQAETVLMRLGRGAGTGGAAAILARKGRFLRPMLRVTRAQVLDYLAARGLPFASDPMNLDPGFLRVRMRQQVLPRFAEAVGPGAIEQLALFAEASAEDAQALDAIARDASARLALDGGLDVVGVRALLPAIRTRVLARLIQEAGLPVTRARLEDAQAALERGGGCALTRHVRLETTGGVLRAVFDQGEASGPLADTLLVPGGWVRHAQLEVALLDGSAPASWQLAIRDDALPLTLRARRPGDRVQLPGGRTAKLQDLLVDQKIPREARDALPIVASQSGLVVAIPGTWPRTPGGAGRWTLVARPLQRSPSDPALGRL